MKNTEWHWGIHVCIWLQYSGSFSKRNVNEDYAKKQTISQCILR